MYEVITSMLKLPIRYTSYWTFGDQAWFVQQFKSVCSIVHLMDSFLPPDSYSIFRDNFRPIHDKHPWALEKIHKQMMEQLQLSMNVSLDNKVEMYIYYFLYVVAFQPIESFKWLMKSQMLSFCENQWSAAPGQSGILPQVISNHAM